MAIRERTARRRRPPQPQYCGAAEAYLGGKVRDAIRLTHFTRGHRRRGSRRTMRKRERCARRERRSAVTHVRGTPGTIRTCDIRLRRPWNRAVSPLKSRPRDSDPSRSRGRGGRSLRGVSPRRPRAGGRAGRCPPPLRCVFGWRGALDAVATMRNGEKGARGRIGMWTHCARTTSSALEARRRARSYAKRSSSCSSGSTCSVGGYVPPPRPLLRRR
jgi:hypothetical protein